jgi:hypothetical protein
MDLNSLYLDLQPARAGFERSARLGSADGRSPPRRLGAAAACHWTLRSGEMAR